MIVFFFLRSTSTIENVQKLLEWGILEDFLKSLLSFWNDLEIRRDVLKAISNILTFQNERIYLMNKMSEFEFQRLLDNIIPAGYGMKGNMIQVFPAVHGMRGNIFSIVLEIQRNLRRGW